MISYRDSWLFLSRFKERICCGAVLLLGHVEHWGRVYMEYSRRDFRSCAVRRAVSWKCRSSARRWQHRSVHCSLSQRADELHGTGQTSWNQRRVGQTEVTHTWHPCTDVIDGGWILHGWKNQHARSAATELKAKCCGPSCDAVFRNYF